MDHLTNTLTKMSNPNNQIRAQGNSLLKLGELEIEQLINQKGGIETIMNYLVHTEHNISLRLGAALYLKNHISKYWENSNLDSSRNNLTPGQNFDTETKMNFQRNLINLFLQCDQKLYSIIKEIIRIICKEGYILQWPNLFQDFSAFLLNANYILNADLYDLIHGITKRYRYEFKSQILFDEIKKSISLIAPRLGDDLMTALAFLYNPPLTDPDFQTRQYYFMKIIEAGMKIFLSFNHQDLPEYFEDNMKYWMSIIKGIIELNDKIFLNNKSIYSLYINIKAKAIRCINFYCRDYYEDMKAIHNDFINPLINVIAEIKPQEEFSKLTKVVLNYFKTIFEKKRTDSLNKDFLPYFIRTMIVPNMRITEKELEDFEDNPNNFLRIELDEADVESNKTLAINVIKDLFSIYPNLNTEYINPIITNLLEEYNSNPKTFYMNKIMVINLLFATVIKNFASRLGVLSLNTSDQYVLELIKVIFIDEFSTNIQSRTLTKIYSLKFLIYFRNQIPSDWLSGVFDMIITICQLPNEKVLNDAGLLTLEKILYMKNLKDSSISICEEYLKNEELYMKIINCLTSIISKESDSFAMKCFFRTVYLTDSSVLLGKLDNFANITNHICDMVSKNTDSKEQFSYYFFEAIAIILTKLYKKDQNAYKYFSELINGSVIKAISSQNQEIMGYGFQLISYMMYFDQTVSEFNINLLTNVINENNWGSENKALYFTFISLIKISFLKVKNFYNQKNLNIIINIVNIIIQQKMFSLAFEVLLALISFFDLNEIGDKNLRELFLILVNHIPNEKVTSKTGQENYAKHLILFTGKFIHKFGTKTWLNYFDMNNKGIAEKFFGRDFDHIFELDSVTKKKVVTYGLCMLMAENFSYFGIDFLKFMTISILNLLDKFHKSSLSLNYNDNVLTLVDNCSFQANSVNKLLNTDVKLETEVLKELNVIDEAKVFFEAIDRIRQSNQVNLINLVFEDLPANSKSFIERYMANIQPRNFNSV